MARLCGCQLCEAMLTLITQDANGFASFAASLRKEL